MSNSFSCVRKSLCCINLLFWVLGCGMLGVGLWLNQSYRGYSKVLISHHVLSGDYLVIVAGVLTFLLGFLGCCGAWFQNKFLLRMYFILVIVVLLLEFTAGTLGFIYRKHIGEALQEELLIGIHDRYAIDNHNGLKETWDHIQTQFRCCGVRNYRDWHQISAWPDKEWVPSSCCLPKFSNISSCGEMEEVSYIYSSGCYPRLHVWLMERMHIVGIISMVFAFIQLFGIISALIIVCSMNPKRR
ncbi:tetraspanin-4 [Parasteatoda tepidariorum]|uniref:tetraspanin-4 n=1 Tax=Parasteatoda tepidariorum TaxID=114398 RepID=UPI00077F818A|nr:tetraspanin-4 [Parasteatoda tepidariorum]